MPKKQTKPVAELAVDEPSSEPMVKQTKKPATKTRAPKVLVEDLVSSPPEEPKPKRKIQTMDIIGFGVIAVVLLVLSITLVSKIKLKHEVTTAQVTAYQAAHDIATNNVTAARKLASKDFLTDPANTTDMPKFFKSMADIYSTTTPKVVTKTVGNNSSTQNVAFIYEFDRLKLPYYVRIDVVKPTTGGTWQLRAIHSNTSEDALLGN